MVMSDAMDGGVFSKETFSLRKKRMISSNFL